MNAPADFGTKEAVEALREEVVKMRAEVSEAIGRLEALQASIDSIASLGSMSAGGTE